VAAITQQITYNEFLPMVLGKEVMSQHDLILLKEGYFDGYDRYQYFIYHIPMNFSHMEASFLMMQFCLSVRRGTSTNELDAETYTVVRCWPIKNSSTIKNLKNQESKDPLSKKM
jgi:hypothetical protein